MITDDSNLQIPLFDVNESAKSVPKKTARKPASDPGGKKKSTRAKSSASSAKSMKTANSMMNKSKRSRQKPVVQESSSGQVPDGDVRLTANIREDLHLKLKIAAARRRTTIGELIEQLVEQFL